MKNLFKNLIKTTLLVSLMFLGAVFADAAGQFINYDPMGGTVTSISGRVDKPQPYNYRSDSLTVSIPNPGDHVDFRVYVAYQNIKDNYNIMDARGTLDFQNSGTSYSTIIEGKLRGSANEPMQDGTTLKGLPNSWSIQLNEAWKANDHTLAKSPYCTGAGAGPDGYAYNSPIGISAVTSGNGAFLNDLDYIGVTNEGITGVCDQGYMIGYFTVTNTEGGNTTSLDVQTDGATGIEDKGVRLNGHLVSGNDTNVWFVINENNSNLDCSTGQRENVSGSYGSGDSFDKYVSGLNSDSHYYYKACADNGSQTDYVSDAIDFYTTGGQNGTDLSIQTTAESNVSYDGATLNGRVLSGSSSNTYFAYGDNSSVSCDLNANNSIVYSVESGTQGIGDYFHANINAAYGYGTYHYRACAEANNGQIISGGIISFVVDESSNGSNSEIKTRNIDNITRTSAEVCGDLVDDGGDTNLRTWMEYRKSSTSSYTRTSQVDRGEGYFCETVRSLSPYTKYYYRACSEDGCDTSSSFNTGNGGSNGDDPIVTTNLAYNITTNSAILPGTYVTNADRATVWFQYGYTPTYLNKDTRHYTKYGTGGSYVHYFTNLKSNQRYCYRAMIETVNGSDHGSVNCFYTKVGGSAVVVVPDDGNDDTSSLGLGLSLVKLEINDHKEKVKKDENVTYEISLENISDLDLENLELVIEIPREIQITSSSRGQLDEDRNAIVYTVNNLDAKENKSMTVTGVVTNGRLGDALTAEATLGFNNPVNEARENATDYDIDEFTVLTALGTASVFGLANITFLGWLTILLGLLIVFLVARWLYLEREELRAQSYVNGYRRVPSMDNNDHRDAHYVDNMNAPTTSQNTVRQVPQARPAQNNPQKGERSDYRPYRPNRG